MEVMNMLNTLYTTFDALVEQYDLYKVLHYRDTSLIRKCPTP